MRRKALLSGLLAGLVLGLFSPRDAMGTTVQLTMTDFTGSDALVLVTLDDTGGVISGNVAVQASPNTGDIRGIFLQVLGEHESILPGLLITGPMVNDINIGNDNITTAGNAHVSGGGTPGPFDIGIEFGTAGIGHDDIQTTAFMIDHALTDLTLAMFDLSRFGLRLTSVGLPGGPREGSSKLKTTDINFTGLTPPPTPNGGEEGGGDPMPGSAPIPEPGTLALGAVAAMFTSGWWWRRRAAARRVV